MNALDLEGLTHARGMGGYEDRAECDGPVEEREGRLVCTTCEATVGDRCGACSEWFSGEDWEDSGMSGDLTDTSLCGECYSMDLDDHASTLVRFSPEGKEVVRFGDHIAMSEQGETPVWFYNLLPEGWTGRPYHRTDAWRGHYDTTFEGLAKLEDGWVTGDYSDVRWKRPTHELHELLSEGDVYPPKSLYWLFEPTSNVFSTAAEILCAPEDQKEITAWLTEQGFTPDVLHEAFG